MQTGGGDVDGKFADRDVDATDALVADAEDAFGVGGHQEINLLRLQTVVAQRLLYVLQVVDVEEHPSWTAVFVAIALDRLTHGRGVDDGQHLLEVIGQQPVEKDLIAVVIVTTAVYWRLSSVLRLTTKPGRVRMLHPTSLLLSRRVVVGGGLMARVRLGLGVRSSPGGCVLGCARRRELLGVGVVWLGDAGQGGFG